MAGARQGGRGGERSRTAVVEPVVAPLEGARALTSAEPSPGLLTLRAEDRLPHALNPAPGGGAAGQAAADGAAEAGVKTAAGDARTSRADRRRGWRGSRAGQRRRFSGLGGRLFLLVFLFGLAALALEYVGKPVKMPVWVVAEVEARLNRALAGALPDGALSVGGIEMTLGDDWVPRFLMDDLRLLQPGGRTLLALPETYLSLDPAGLLQGQLRARSLRIVGARIAIHRDRDGHFDIALGGGQGPRIDTLAALFATFDRAFALPALTHLRGVEVEALSLSLTDQRAGKTWEVGDGHLSIENRPAELAAQLSMSLVAGGSAPAHAVFTAVAAKGTGSARISAQVDRVAAVDLAAQTPLLSWLGVLDAPISGRIAATIDTKGIEALDGSLDIAAGALKPSAKTTPIAFDKASLSLGYDSAAGRIILNELTVQSRTLRLTSKGQSYLVDEQGKTITGALSGRRPAAFLGQIQVAGLSIDPAGLFAAPVQFSQGSADLRLRLDPFAIDIGQVSLTDGGEHLAASGQVAADEGGWRVGVDLTLNQISRDRLLSLWPLQLVPGTRSWVANNIRNADLSDLHAALRIAPGTEPRTELSYDFKDADLSFMAKMPPVKGADGYATIQGKTYTQVVSHGEVTPPEGGPIDVSGTVFAVPDITAMPAVAHIDLHMSGALTATLSLLDQPPFFYLQKAGQPVDLGSGPTVVSAQITLPLIPRVMPWDVDFKVAAQVSDFTSEKVVKGHVVTAPILRVAASPKGMTIAGQGLLGKVPFDVTLQQDFPVQLPPAEGEPDHLTPASATAEPPGPRLPEALNDPTANTPVPAPGALPLPGTLALAAPLVVPKVADLPPAAAASAAVPPARMTGRVTLSQDAVSEFGLGLPAGMVTGQAQAEVSLQLAKGVPGQLRLSSDLAGMTLAIPDLGWRKAPEATGRLETEIRLGTPPQITRLDLTGAGLAAQGRVTLNAKGGLDVAQFDKVTMGGWLNGAVSITGRGPASPVALAVTSGSIDLRKFPQNRSSGGSSSGSPLSISLQSLRVTEGIRITGFAGDFSLKGGFNGTFSGAVNGSAPVTGTAVPTRYGTAVRILSPDAGLTMQAAGMFSSAHGGDLDMTLVPRPKSGEYDGQATIRRFRVKYGSVMADLLSAISVIGLLDQLAGDGIVFEHAEAQFLITPTAIDIQKGSAIGASMGVSVEGLYHSDSGLLDLRGVVSPIYMLNGIGSILTRKGEGLFGFAYRLTGDADKPDVSVNPLSILTPGMFRDLFRAPASTLTPPVPPPPGTQTAAPAAPNRGDK